jgi:hypothetical protein
MAVELGDLADNGYDVSAQRRQVADGAPVACQSHGSKRTLAAPGAERNMSGAAARGGDLKDPSGNTAMFANQLRSLGGRRALDANLGKHGTWRLCLRAGLRRDGGDLGWLRQNRHGEQQGSPEQPEQNHLVGSILSELLKRLK